MKIELVPEPKEIISHRGELRIPTESAGSETCFFLVSDKQALASAELIAPRFNARIVPDTQPTGVHIRLNIVKDLGFTHKLRADLRIESYRLEVSKKSIELSALTVEGVLRGAATLFQITRMENGWASAPCVVISDWPNFRYRCAADWLINVECNRWAYDRGDGRTAFLERIKRKLDFCFAHKINMVWFDGFGWNTERFPGYAPLVRDCTSYARRLGIKLLFGGYGGGYGTAYQGGEIYRCGYFGKVYLNKRPYPDGKEYDCCGWSDNASRRYGTCPSNEQLRAAKLEEMKRFVNEVHPGFMYIHDIDGDAWMAVKKTWSQRCDECRKHWPSDELSDADGHAGAYASWFRQVRRALSALPASGDYSPARDLVLIFTSPLYTNYGEREPENVWELEMRYFDSLSRLIGPEPGVEFGLREQFYHAGNRKKIGSLREMLDKNGNGHGIHVISFGGGDNYLSDDLTNVSGTMAHFYDGAESVCISNGGMHQEPVQMLNASFLWSGFAGGYRENPADEREAESVFQKIAAGGHKPPDLFASDGYFDRLCARLWGQEAGQAMSRALQARHDGQLPISHVWWSITKSMAKLKNDEPCSFKNLVKACSDREVATTAALEHARKAAAVSDNEDVHWFVKCLEVGKQFAEAVKWLAILKSGNEKTAAARLRQTISDLEAHLRKNFDLEKTDVLGGDPGCWLETIAEIKRLPKSFLALRQKDGILSDFIVNWRVSRAMPSAGKLDNLIYPHDFVSLQFAPRLFSAAFCDLHHDVLACAPDDVLVYFANRFNCAEAMNLELRLGYDGPVKAWIDGTQVFHDPNGTNPGKLDKAIIPWKAAAGNHELLVALGSNNGKAWGIFARFLRKDDHRSRQKPGSENCSMFPVGELD